jgi:hypothetical protein
LFVEGKEEEEEVVVVAIEELGRGREILSAFQFLIS